MKNRALKLSLGALAAVALTVVAVACDGANDNGGKPEDPKTYAVTYDLNGGKGTLPTEADKAKGASFTLAAGDGLSKDGHVFDGWHDGDKKYDGGATYNMPEKNVTFTAQWKLEDEDGQKYTITYDLNGGKGTLPTEADKAKGASFTLAAGDGLSKDGHVFDGWHDGTTKYDGGATYTMPENNVKLTAQWRLEDEDGQKYTITYDLNGGTGTLPTETDKEEGASFKLADGTGLTKMYYTFDGWHDGTTKYDGGATYTMPENNVKLTAQWKLAPGIDLPEEGVAEYVGDCTLPKKSGYLSEKGGEHIVGIALDSENKDLYYKLSGGTGWIKSTAKYFDANKQYMPDKYGTDALYFEGKIGEVNYYTLIKPDLSEITLCDTDDEILEGGVFTNAAIAAPLTVTVTFDLGYNKTGVNNPDDQKIANGGNATAPTIADREGYTFGGWHVGTEDGELFDFDTPVTSDLNLVAKWISDGVEYTITFTAPEGATGTAPATINVDNQTNYTIPANTFTKEGWTFYRWKNTEYGSYAGVGATYKATKNIEYVAVFQKTYSITGDEYYTSMILLDDGNAMFDGYSYPYTLTDGLLNVPDLQTKYKLNETNNTFVAADYISTYTTYSPIKANEGETPLAFDGFGTVTLGSHTGTYQYNADTFAVSNITFADATVNTLAIEYSMYTYSATGSITFENGDTYTFGTVTPDPGPEDPDDPPQDDYKLYDFAAEGAANSVKYGYASVDDATTAEQAIVVDHKNLSDTTHTFFKCYVYYNTSGKLLVYLYRAAPTASDPNKTANISGAKINGQDITDPDIANQPIVISNNNYDEFQISFSMVDGKRTMTIKCGDTTVTWTEMTA